MNNPRKIMMTALVLAAAGAVGACTSSPPPSSSGGSFARSGVEGSWIDAQGTGLSTFSGGTFQTVATDTGQRLSDGSYRMTGPTSVEISGTSLIRQTPISFNCLMVSTSQLNCTSATGQNFVLTRRA